MTEADLGDLTPATGLVPKAGVTSDDVGQLADALGWKRHATVEPGPGAPYEEVWLTADGRTGVHWIADDLQGVEYLLVEGENQAAVAGLLREHLDLHDTDSLTTLIEGAGEIGARTRAIRSLGLAATGPFDRRVHDLLTGLLGDPDPLLRRVAILASTLPAWPEMIAPLERLAGTDPDPELRDLAGRMADLERRRQRAKAAAGDPEGPGNPGDPAG